ncbi:MAG: hypothetical protein D6730_20880 [Bacteroidetes bacterium]|nr:MAG: hypothetical protein D6730_20880 [Bacteroidota bacterium]
MRSDQYKTAIEEVLMRIPQLEKALQGSNCPREKRFLNRSLKSQEKRFERMIPYQHRRALQALCDQVGVRGEFF